MLVTFEALLGRLQRNWQTLRRRASFERVDRDPLEGL